MLKAEPFQQPSVPGKGATSQCCARTRARSTETKGSRARALGLALKPNSWRMVLGWHQHRESDMGPKEINAELERLKDAIGKLPVKDEAGRTRILNQVETMLRVALDHDSANRYVNQINKTSFYPIVYVGGGRDFTPRTWAEGAAKVAGLIEAAQHQMSLMASVKNASETGPKGTKAMDSIFVVHGHDETVLRKVEAYIRRIGLRPVILVDEASGNRTVIEKLERHADVPFALVLFSLDDFGRPASARESALKRRPRQNAVLELGFFMGRLGRENVCVIVDAALDKEAEYPSDMAGIVTIHYRPGGDWQTRLVREFREAGLAFQERST